MIQRSDASPLTCRELKNPTPTQIENHHPSTMRVAFPLGALLVVLPKDAVSREGGVHVTMEIGGALQVNEPHLVALLQAQDGRVGRRRPERDALRPHGHHHPPVDHQVHRSLQQNQRPVITRSSHSGDGAGVGVGEEMR